MNTSLVILALIVIVGTIAAVFLFGRPRITAGVEHSLAKQLTQPQEQWVLSLWYEAETHSSPDSKRLQQRTNQLLHRISQHRLSYKLNVPMFILPDSLRVRDVFEQALRIADLHDASGFTTTVIVDKGTLVEEKKHSNRFFGDPTIRLQKIERDKGFLEAPEMLWICQDIMNLLQVSAQHQRSYEFVEKTLPGQVSNVRFWGIRPRNSESPEATTQTPESMEAPRDITEHDSNEPHTEEPGPQVPTFCWLTQERLDELQLHLIAFRTNLNYELSLRGLPDSYKAKIPRSQVPQDDFSFLIQSLNRTPHLENEEREIPFQRWLLNAEKDTEPLPESLDFKNLRLELFPEEDDPTDESE